MAIGTPSIASPVDGSAALNWHEPICLRLSAFVDTAPPSTSTERQNCITDLDGNWTNSVKFTNGTEFMDDQASATAIGKANRHGFSGLNFTASPTLILSNLLLTLDYLAEWTTPPNYAGNVYCKGLLSYKQRTVQVCKFPTPTTQWTNTHTSTVTYRKKVSILATVRDILGKRNVTIGDVEGIAADLHVVVAVAGARHNCTNFHAGPLSLEAVYYSSNPLTQVAVQWQFATDTGFSSIVYDTGVVDTVEDYLWLPADALPPGSTLYARVKQKASDSTFSSFSATRTFTTLSTAAVGVLQQGASTVLVADFELRMFIDGCRWTAGGLNSNMWYLDLPRSGLPSPAFRVLDILEEGIAKGYTERAADTDFVGNGEFAYPVGVNERLWVRTSDARPPGGCSDHGIQVLVGFGLASKGLLAGPGDTYEYRGLIKNQPAIQDSIDDLVSGHGAIATSGLELDNADGFFNAFLANVSPDYGWIAHQCRVQLSVVGSHSLGVTKWADRHVLWDGLCEWERAVVDGTTVRLALASRKAETEARLGVTRFTKDEYPNLRDADVGLTIPEMYGGFDQVRVPAYVVDYTGRILRPVVKATTVVHLWAAGGSVDMGTSGTKWSFDSTTGHINILTAGNTDFDNNKDGDFRCEISVGDRLTNSQSGNLAQCILQRGGVPASRIVSASFDKYTSVAQLYLSEETVVGDLLRQLAAVDGFHVVQRADQMIEAVPDVPDGPEARTVIILSKDVISPPRFSISTDHMCAVGSLRFKDQKHNAHKNVEDGMNSGAYPSDLLPTATRAATLYQIRREIAEDSAADVKVDIGEEVPVVARYFADADRPRLHLEVDTSLRHALAIAGNTALVSLDEALLPPTPVWWPAGIPRRFEWELCKVLSRTRGRDGVTLSLRWLKTLPKTIQP